MKLLYSFAIYCVNLLILENSVQARIYVEDSYGETVAVFPNRFATYLSGEVNGYMEASIPPDACTEIHPPTFPQNYTLNKIILINGTAECDFMTKVQNARSAGYDTAVLFDPYPGFFDYPNLSFPFEVSKFNINVFLISYEDAISIHNFLYRNNCGDENFIIEIFVDWTLMEHIIFAGILLVGSYIIFSICKWLKYRIRNALRNRNAASNNAANPASSDYLRARLRDLDLLIASVMAQQQPTLDSATALRQIQRTFPSKEFSQEDASFQTCVICYNEFQIGERIRVLGCCHVYHAACIDDWFVEKHFHLTCPLCQQSFRLVSSGEHSSLALTDSDSESAPLLNPTNGLPSTSGDMADNSYNASYSVYCTPVGSVNAYDSFLAGDKGSVNSA